MAPSKSSGNKKMIHSLRRIFGLCLAFAFACIVIPKVGGLTADPFVYHPVAFTFLFLAAMPELMTTIGALKKKSTNPATVGSRVNNHQLAAFLFQLCAAVGFGAIEYVKFSKGYPHFKSPHAILGTVCGVAVVLQVTVGAILRYVLSATNSSRRTFVTIHGSLSMIISITGLTCFVGGMTQTPFAIKMVPEPWMRAVFAFGAPTLMVVGYAAA